MPAGSDPRVRRLVGGTLCFIALLGSGACGGKGSSTASEPVVATTTFPSLAPGQGALVLAGSLYRFTVQGCVDGAAPGDEPQARQQFRLTGAGRVAALPFTVLVTRYSSDTGVGGTTITETALVSTGSGDAAKGVEAKRTQAGGHWIDLMQPGVGAALITRAGREVKVTGRFGPEGSKVGDPGVIGGRLVARCPA